MAKSRTRKSTSKDPFQKSFLKELSPEQSRPGLLKEFISPTRAEFDLVSEYAPAGDQPKAIQEISRAFGADRKSTRLNSSHVRISYAVFCLKKKKKIR